MSPAQLTLSKVFFRWQVSLGLMAFVQTPPPKKGFLEIYADIYLFPKNIGYTLIGHYLAR